MCFTYIYGHTPQNKILKQNTELGKNEQDKRYQQDLPYKIYIYDNSAHYNGVSVISLFEIRIFHGISLMKFTTKCSMALCNQTQVLI